MVQFYKNLSLVASVSISTPGMRSTCAKAMCSSTITLNSVFFTGGPRYNFCWSALIYFDSHNSHKPFQPFDYGIFSQNTFKIVWGHWMMKSERRYF